MKYQQTVQVLWNRPVSSVYHRIGLTCHPGYSASAPGQFVMLRLSDQGAPLLRRPFSIHRLLREADRVQGVELLYKVVGTGTRKLAGCREGDRLDMLGPLGNGFSIPESHSRIYMAAGGIGVAPMLFLAHFLAERGLDPSRMTLFLGGRTVADLLCRDAFLQLGLTVYSTTDDGSDGDQCLVTHPLEEAVRRSPPDILYACGPREMLTCIVGIAEHYSVPCQVSIETDMACGIGACLGCAVQTREESETYFHACLNGPVFDTRQIKL